MSVRDTILSRLRETLRQPNLPFPPPETTALSADERMTVTHAAGDAWALAERFALELSALKGSCELVETPAEARMATIARLRVWVEEEQAARKTARAERPGDFDVLCWPPALLPLDGLGPALKDLGFQPVEPEDLHDPSQRERIRLIRAGVTGVEAAFASTGTFVVKGSGPGSRAASLTPFRHLVLIPFSQLFPTGEAWLASKRAAGELDGYVRASRNLTFVSGPSKSADIEGNLTMGVHGPKVVHAILFDDTTTH